MECWHGRGDRVLARERGWSAGTGGGMECRFRGREARGRAGGRRAKGGEGRANKARTVEKERAVCLCARRLDGMTRGFAPLFTPLLRLHPLSGPQGRAPSLCPGGPACACLPRLGATSHTPQAPSCARARTRATLFRLPPCAQASALCSRSPRARAHARGRPPAPPSPAAAWRSPAPTPACPAPVTQAPPAERLGEGMAERLSPAKRHSKHARCHKPYHR